MNGNELIGQEKIIPPPGFILDRPAAQSITPPKGLALDKSTAALTPTPPVTPVQKTATQADVNSLANYILNEAQRQNKICTQAQALTAARSILISNGYIIK